MCLVRRITCSRAPNLSRSAYFTSQVCVGTSRPRGTLGTLYVLVYRDSHVFTIITLLSSSWLALRRDGSALRALIRCAARPFGDTQQALCRQSIVGHIDQYVKPPTNANRQWEMTEAIHVALRCPKVRCHRRLGYAPRPS